MIGARLSDAVLDRSVVPGYTKIGFQLRRRTWRGEELPSLRGRRALVTGGTSGIGLAAAEGLAGLGAAVRIVGRDATRAKRACEGIIERSGNEDVSAYTCDLGDMRSVRRLVGQVTAQERGLHVLVNNAGVLTRERTLSPEGIELTFATNVLGPFLLTGMLHPLLQSSAPARIVNVSSGGMYTQRLAAEDLQSEQGKFDGTRAYARAKRSEVVLNEMWAERLRGTGVVSNAMHPGWADTPGLRSSLPGFHRAAGRLLRTPGEAADTILWLAAAERAATATGGFWHDRRERPTHRVPWTKESEDERERLWDECARLSGWSHALETLHQDERTG